MSKEGALDLNSRELEARAGGCAVTGSTVFSIQTMLFPLHRCDIHHFLCSVSRPSPSRTSGSRTCTGQPPRRTLIGSISTSTRTDVEPEPPVTRAGHHQVGSWLGPRLGGIGSEKYLVINEMVIDVYSIVWESRYFQRYFWCWLGVQ